MTRIPRDRVFRALRRVVDVFPWTGLGLLVASAASGALVYYAYQEMDLVLLVLGYGALGLLGLGTLFVLVGVVLLHLGRSASSSTSIELETSRARPTGFSLPSLRWVPLVRVRWSWITPRSFALKHEARLGRLHESVVPTQRGEYGDVERRVLVEDVFGLARMGRWHDAALTLRVLPHIGALRQMPVLISFAGGDDWPHPMGVLQGDRLELRRYAPGDPARFIHWKIFGRTRKLVVRTPERALTQAQRTVAYLVTGVRDGASAGAARVAIETRALGDEWAFATDGFPDGTDRIDAALNALVHSVEHRATAGADLEKFLRRQERSGPASVVLFVPPEPGPWMEAAAAALSARRGRSRVVIGVDGLASTKPASLWRRILTQPRGMDTASAQALDEVIARLASTRAPIVVVDRVSGKVLGEAHRKAVRERKAA